MKNYSLADMLAGAINLVKTGDVQPGEQVCILTDTRSYPECVEAVVAAVRLAGAEPTVVTTRPLGRYENVPAPALEAMRACTTLVQMYPVFLAFSKNFGRLRSEMKPGFKLLNVDDSTPEVFASIYTQYPLELIYTIAKRLRDVVNEAHTLRITAPNGTDIRCDYDPHDMFHITTEPLKPGGRTHFPTGSIGIYAGELPAEGVIYLECLQGVPGMLRTPVEWVIRDAKVVEINGGPEAELIRQVVDAVPSGRSFSEIMLGYHPKASYTRGVRDDFHWEINRMPTGWFGMGRGHRVTANVHVDGGTLNCTAYVGDTPVIENGRLLCLADADIREIASKYGDPDELLSPAF